MRVTNIGDCKTVNGYVRKKLQALQSSDRSFAALYSLMFSERENLFWEKSIGYRIERTSYGESYDRIERKAKTLQTLTGALPPDSIIGIHMENSLDWIEAFWAVLRAGFRPLLMNIRLDPALLQETLAVLQVRLVLSDGAVFPVRTVLAPELVPAAQPMEKGQPFGSSVLLMSSGTTEGVKVCAYTSAELCLQIADSDRVITRCRQMKQHYHGNLKLLTFLPFYHIFGLMAVYIWFAFFSRCFVQLNDLRPETICNTIRRHEVTHIFAVPLFWNTVYGEAHAAIRRKGEKTEAKFQKGMRLGEALQCLPFLYRAYRKIAFREVREQLFGESVRFMITGGSEIQSEVLSFFNGIGYHLANGYGMTELGIASVELSRDPKKLICGSVGKPMSSLRYTVNDRGELQVEGASMAATVFVGGKWIPRPAVFSTKDLAVCRKGCYYILGREDDLVISPSGENLNPVLLEERMMGIPHLSEVALIAHREESGVVPTLLCQTERSIRPEQLLALQDAVRQRLMQIGMDKQISRLFFTSAELVPQGEIKKNRRKLRERYESGELPECTSASVSTLSDDALTQLIAQCFSEVLHRPVEEITDSFDFFLDGGGNSLDYAAAITVLGAQLDTVLPLGGIEQGTTVAGIRAYLCDRGIGNA